MYYNVNTYFIGDKNKMTTKQAIKKFGGIKELAAALGIWPHNISRWGTHPPAKRQRQIKEILENV